jgi:hypothetical protein
VIKVVVKLLVAVLKFKSLVLGVALDDRPTVAKMLPRLVSEFNVKLQKIRYVPAGKVQLEDVYTAVLVVAEREAMVEVE